MPNLIDTSFFTGPLAIPQISEPSVLAELQAFIDFYEPRFMTNLLGKALYSAYNDAPADARFVDLIGGKEYTNRWGVPSFYQGIIQGKESPIAYYIFYYWLREHSTIMTGTGEKVAKAQNSTSVYHPSRMSRAWNMMADLNKQMNEFIRVNTLVYPEFQIISTMWDFRYRHSSAQWELFHPINALGF